MLKLTIYFCLSAEYHTLGCPEGEQRVSPATFAHMTHSLRALGAPLVALLEGGYFLPSLAEGAALTLRQLLGAPCPLLPPLGACCGEMESSIQGVQGALSPYWGCFRHMAAVEVPDSVWCGPEVPETAPYDIMSPTPPRAEAEDRLYRLEVAKCIATTPLHPPPPHCLGLAPHTALQLGVQGLGGLRLGDPLSLLLKREVAVALVVGGLAEVCSGLVGRVEKVLLVTCTQEEEEEQEESELSAGWSEARLVTTSAGDCQLEGSAIQGDFRTVVSAGLLPRAYTLAPELVVLRLGPPGLGPRDWGFLLGQLGALGEGRGVVLLPPGPGGAGQGVEVVRKILDIRS